MLQPVQLSLDVKQHPDLQYRDGTYVAGTLKVQGDYRVDQDLNAGDALIVVIQDADGQVLSQARAVVGQVSLLPIEEKDLGVIGTGRAHKAKLTDE